MAKVTMPLMSGSATGKLASAIVFFTWKGLNVVRSWCIPSNPRDIDQRIIRQKMGAIGKVISEVVLPGTGIQNGSKLYQLIKAKMPSGWIWNAYLASKALNYAKNDASFTALSAALFGGTPASLTCWQTCATAINLVDLTGHEYATTISPELQLYLAAYGCYLMALSSSTYKYNDNPTTWVAAKIVAFKDDIITVK